MRNVVYCNVFSFLSSASDAATSSFEIDIETDKKAKTGENVKLTCKPKGDIKSVEWKKDGQMVSQRLFCTNEKLCCFFLTTSPVLFNICGLLVVK